jgi:hypothetical protein
MHFNKCGLGMQEHFERLWLRKATNMARNFNPASTTHSTKQRTPEVGDWADLVWQGVHLWRDRGAGAPGRQWELLYAVSFESLILNSNSNSNSNSTFLLLPYPQRLFPSTLCPVVTVSGN